MTTKQCWLVVEGDGDEDSFAGAVRLPEGEFWLGTDAKCHLVLPDASVSPAHAVITRTGERVLLNDLGSKAGTYLNDEKVMSCELKAGDRFIVGGTALRVADEPPKPPRRGASGAEGPRSHQDTVNWQPFRLFLDRLRASGDPKDILERLLSGLINMLGAERGFVLLRQRPDGDKLVPVTTHSIADAEQFVSVSRTVCLKALQKKALLVIEDSSSPGEAMSSDSMVQMDEPRTILCCPLQAQGNPFGVIYVDMPRPQSSIDPTQLRIFKTVTGLASELVAAHQTRKALLATKGRLQALSRLAFEEDELVFGESPFATELRNTISTAAAQDITVLLTGETGTGKEMVARALHQGSARREGPFIPVNCAALPHDIIEAELFGAERGAYTGAEERRVGRFELASGGTLFLDEIGELPLDTQIKLLRVLQERSITRLGGTQSIPLDFRLVCATNSDLEAAIGEGKFRQDFYYRVNVFRVHLKPLRERIQDILPLARHFLEHFARRSVRRFKGLLPEAERVITSYSWPGNIRELKNAIERAVVVETAEWIRPSALPVKADDESGQVVDEASLGLLVRGYPGEYEPAKMLFERAFIKRCFEDNRGNVTAMARTSGLTRPSIYRRLEWLNGAPEGGLATPALDDEAPLAPTEPTEEEPA